MIKFYAICLALGLASGLMNISVVFVGVPAIALNLFSALPLFLLGLGLGTQAVLIGALIGAGLTLLIGGGLAASYGLAVALPAVVLTRQAILARQDKNGKLRWYPLESLVLILAGLAALNLLLAHFLASGQEGGLIGEIIDQVRRLMKMMETKGMPAVSDADRERSILSMSRLLLAVLAIVWMFGLVINGAIAQEILRRLKRNIRPKADIVDLALPKWLSFAFVLSIAATMTTAPLDSVGLVAVGLCIAAYILQGLAVLHALARRWSRPEFILLGSYVLILVVGWPIALVAIIGFFDSLFGFRQRLLVKQSAGSHNDQEDE